MRVAVVTESFLPSLNGVTTSVRHVLEQLAARGHEAIVITPSAESPRRYAGFAVHEVPAIGYRSFQVGMPVPQVQQLLARFAPDVIHAASPFLLGTAALAAGRRLGIATVAIYQTDVARYARRNRLRALETAAWNVVRRVHEGADLTLAPSTAALADLRRLGLTRLALWGRGVDVHG
ncbi:glycosyltransferase [Ruicaihuangia caeni]|uniref:D-inositol 3-phosphate glycosyltransferase n=1 Tax=Ruicaihuangia caeni TaxID=3042517 RepID=A0AAW6TBB7_9MICO|nr:glycosyltransferase [Klugiella sp. YN-L-19]MDI2099340.1 glycosyltransferase [Klugiella sp. YN-L-19]